MQNTVIHKLYQNGCYCGHGHNSQKSPWSGNHTWTDRWVDVTCPDCLTTGCLYYKDVEDLTRTRPLSKKALPTETLAIVRNFIEGK
jgi:hypothetical protein